LALVLLMASCGGSAENGNKTVPAHIIAPSEMSSILADIHISEASLEYKTITPGDTLKLLARTYYQHVFNKYGIDADKFRQSMDYYKDNPVQMDKVYEQVIEKLSAQSASHYED
jgi:hypothetical protein